MTKVEDIEKAVEELSPQELARFRAWFEEFDARLFDARRVCAAPQGPNQGMERRVR